MIPRRYAIFAAALIVSTAAMAQTPSAVVNGTVVDPSGAAVPDARVRVVNQDTNVASEKNTGQDGAFNIINLLPGNYVLTVEKSGFKKARASGIQAGCEPDADPEDHHASRRFHRDRNGQRGCRWA